MFFPEALFLSPFQSPNKILKWWLELLGWNFWKKENLLGFSERRKLFPFSFLTQKFYIKLFSQMSSAFLVGTDLLSLNCSKYHKNVVHTTVVLLKFNFSKLYTSKATLFTWLNKSFWIRAVLIGSSRSNEHYNQQ